MFKFEEDGWFHQLVIYETLRIYLNLESTHVTTDEDLQDILLKVSKQNLKRIPFLIVSHRGSRTHFFLFIGSDEEYKGYDTVKDISNYNTIKDILGDYSLKDYYFAIPFW